MINLSKINSLVAVLVYLVPLSVFAAEKDVYDFLWLDQDKKVYVLQNKTYTKANTWHFDVGYLSGMSGEFQDSSGFQVATGYNWSEQWGIELLYNSYTNTDNSALKSLNQVNSSMPFIRRFNSSYGALIKWDPFYGKINTFNKIIYFDWSFGAGVGMLDAESNALTAQDTTKDVFLAEKYTGVLLKTEIKVHTSEHWNIGVQILRTVYSGPGPLINGTQTNSLRGNSDLVISLGFSF